MVALLAYRISGSGSPDRFLVDDGGAHDGPLSQLQPLGFRVGVDFLNQSLTRFVFCREAAELRVFSPQANEPPDPVGLVEQSLPPRIREASMPGRLRL